MSNVVLRQKYTDTARTNSTTRHKSIARRRTLNLKIDSKDMDDLDALIAAEKQNLEGEDKIKEMN